MSSTKDALGNHFEGNIVSGSPWNPEKLLGLLHQSLGSKERALLTAYNEGAWRIDWRPNEETTEETLEEAISKSRGHDIQQTGSAEQKNLAENARFAMSLTYGYSGDVRKHQFSPYLMQSGLVDNFVNTRERLAHRFTLAASFWAVARDSMVAFFIKEGSNTFFISQGLLLDARLPFPGSQFSIAIKGVERAQAAVQNGTNLLRVAVAGEVANFEHIRKADGTPMTSEVELYLREESDGDYLGYAANLWKLHLEDSQMALEIGEIIVMDLSRATGYYKGEGEVPCIVVGRYGTTNNTTLAGDYIVMRIAL